jgi:hypothetical protein
MRPHRREGLTREDLLGTYLPRGLALVSAFVLWYFSIVYSTGGFGYEAGSAHAWMGTGIAIFGVTTLEILFNNGHHRGNQTLTLLCGAAYVYGVGSNVVGIWSDWGAPGREDPKFLTTIIGAVALGLILEIAPELLLNVGLGAEVDDRDFVSQLGQLFGPGTGGGGGFRPPQAFRAPMGFPRPAAPPLDAGPFTGKEPCPQCRSLNTIQARTQLVCLDCQHREPR